MFCRGEVCDGRNIKSTYTHTVLTLPRTVLLLSFYMFNPLHGPSILQGRNYYYLHFIVRKLRYVAGK